MGSIHVTWWNLQNFFDIDDDPISRDFEYTAEHGWTQDVFSAKKSNLAAGLSATHDGAGPDLLCVAEIEKDSLLADLVSEMGNPHMKVVVDQSGTSDLRGIDVAMAYDDRKLRVISHHSHLVHLRYRTRDIFEVVFEIIETGEILAVFGNHWPSRRMGKYRSEPLRIAVAEHMAYLAESHVKILPEDYEILRNTNELAPVKSKWEAKVLIMGDFNDAPDDRSISEHLKASNEIDRVTGETNDIDGFRNRTSDYRGQDVFLFNATAKFVPIQNVGTYFLDTLMSGEKFANRYQILDQIIVSRGLISGHGLTLDLDSVDIFRDPLVATGSGRPRSFSKRNKKGTSDHLPVTAVLKY